MVDITILELNLPESTFSTTLPFGGSNRFDDAEDGESADSSVEADAEESGGSKAKVVVGIFVFLVVAAALVKYLTGDDEDHEVEIETPEEPIGVTIDDEDDE